MVVECPKKCLHLGNSVWKTLRKDLEQHLKTECSQRRYKCEHCGLEDTYDNITGKNSLNCNWITVRAHYDICQDFPLICPNKCGVDGIKRRLLESHRSVCPLQYVECPFAEAGCKLDIRRHQLAGHISSDQQQHLLLMMGAYKQMKERLHDTEARLTAAVRLLSLRNSMNEETVRSLIGRSSYLMKSGESVEVTMAGFSEFHQTGKVWKSRPFYFKEGYKMRLEVSIKEVKYGVSTVVSAKICLLKGEFDDQLKWPVVCPAISGGKDTVYLCTPLSFGEDKADCAYFKVCSMPRGSQGTKDEEIACIVPLNNSLIFKIENVSGCTCTLKVSFVTMYS